MLSEERIKAIADLAAQMPGDGIAEMLRDLLADRAAAQKARERAEAACVVLAEGFRCTRDMCCGDACAECMHTMDCGAAIIVAHEQRMGKFGADVLTVARQVTAALVRHFQLAARLSEAAAEQMGAWIVPGISGTEVRETVAQVVAALAAAKAHGLMPEKEEEA